MSGSMENMEAELLATLSSALDVSKLISAFNTLFQVVKVQEKKLNDSEEMIRNLSEKMEQQSLSEALEAIDELRPISPKSPLISSRQKSRLDQLEAKIDEIHHSLYGGKKSRPVSALDKMLSKIDIDQDPSSAYQNSMKVVQVQLKDQFQRTPSGKKKKKPVDPLTLLDDMQLEITISRPNTPFTEISVQNVTNNKGLPPLHNNNNDAVLFIDGNNNFNQKVSFLESSDNNNIDTNNTTSSETIEVITTTTTTTRAVNNSEQNNNDITESHSNNISNNMNVNNDGQKIFDDNNNYNNNIDQQKNKNVSFDQISMANTNTSNNNNNNNNNNNVIYSHNNNVDINGMNNSRINNFAGNNNNLNNMNINNGIGSNNNFLNDDQIKISLIIPQNVINSNNKNFSHTINDPNSLNPLNLNNDNNNNNNNSNNNNFNNNGNYNQNGPYNGNNNFNQNNQPFVNNNFNDNNNNNNNNNFSNNINNSNNFANNSNSSNSISNNNSRVTNNIEMDEFAGDHSIPLMGRRFRKSSAMESVPTEKRVAILKELRNQGTYIRTAKRMLEDARKKSAEENLASKVDFLDGELKRVNAKYERLRKASKKNFAFVKEVIPPNFDQAYARMVLLINAVGSIGGPKVLIDAITSSGVKVDTDNLQIPMSEDLTNAIAKLTEELGEVKQQNEELQNQLSRHHRQLSTIPDGNEIVRFSQQGQLPEEMMNQITDKIKSTALNDLHNATTMEMNKLRSRLVDFSSDAFTRSDLQKMLQLPSANHSSDLMDQSSDPDSIVTDPNHTKLIGLINKSVDMYNQKLELTKKQYNSINMGPTSRDLEEVGNASQKYTDAKMKRMVELVKSEILSISQDVGSRSDKLEEDVVSINDNMNSLLANQMALMKQSMDMETRKRESAIIRDLQRKMASFSTEKLMDEITKLQRDLKEKPSATKVADMLNIIEANFKSNMGASTSGIRNYIEQLYRAVQHKVDRDDIRAMINSKIGELESDLIQKEDDLLSVASTTRCLSCGVASRAGSIGTPLKPIRKSVGDDKNDHSLMTDNLSSSTEANNNNNDITSQLTGINSQFSSVERRPKTVTHSPDIGILSASDEEVQSLLSGTAGLKPIMKRQVPSLEVTVSKSTNSKKHLEKSTEPLYRKAKAAAQMKEMVKINESTANYYNMKNNSPVYVLENDDSQSMGSIGNGSYSSIGSSSLPYIRNGDSSRITVTPKQNNPLSISSSKLNTYF